MRLNGKGKLYKFLRTHSDLRTRLEAWICEVEAAEWHTPHDVISRYPKASIIGDRRVVFNLRGNRYRVDTKIDYKTKIVLVVRIGTHEEYDSWNF